MSFEALLAGGEGVTLKPTTIGETLGGVIVAAESRQVMDYSTQEPKTWKDGKPQIQIVITVTTGNKTDDGEDELGKIYIKTWGEQKQALLAAIRDTGLDADHALAPGNTMTVTYRGEKPNENPRFNAVKLYEYVITPRSNIGGTLNTTPPPAPAPAAAPSPDNAVSTARQLIAQGLDDTTIATATGLEPTVIAAIRDN